MPSDDRPLVPFGEVRPRALVVDDDIGARELFATVLRRAGIETVVARDGKRALEILERDAIHLVILDRDMPGLNGLDLIERVCAEPTTAHLPVILVTGDTDLTDRVYGLETVEHLRARDRITTDLASAVAAELRSQLTTVCGYVELLGESSADGPSTRQRSMLDSVESAIGGILAMIANLSTIETRDPFGIQRASLAR